MHIKKDHSLLENVKSNLIGTFNTGEISKIIEYIKINLINAKEKSTVYYDFMFASLKISNPENFKFYSVYRMSKY